MGKRKKIAPFNPAEIKLPGTVDATLEGKHNLNLQESSARLIKGSTYKDLSTVVLIPTRGTIHAKVVQSWWNLMMPMNQKNIKFFIAGHEVGVAYTQTIESILQHPELRNWKYILTMEDDCIPPPDGLLKLYESMDKFDVVQGLYWTKGEGGQPMIYGDPQVVPKNFIPQVPRPETVQECNGLGMGFNLFKMKIFQDERIEKPWFRTVQEVTPSGAQAWTQDLWFFNNCAKWGYRFACDTRVRVGHFDAQSDIVW
jgi:hypothetical protein